MAEIKKYYTNDGLRVLKNRLDNWIYVLNEKKFPLKAQSLGFGKFIVKNAEELIGRIRELAETTNTSIEIKETIEKFNNKEIKSYEVKYGS